MFYYFVVPLITRLVRTILLLLFSSPSSFPIRMLKALLPTSSPCCSTVVSFGSVLWAMAPSVNPQMDTSSGTFMPTSLQAYSMPEAVSSLMAKKPSGRWRVHGCRTTESCCRPLEFYTSSWHPGSRSGDSW